MKKLMIAAAIVCAAIVGQAAMVNWDVAWAYSNDGAGINTYDDGSAVNYWIVNMGSATDTSGLSIDKDGNLVFGSGQEYQTEREGMELLAAASENTVHDHGFLNRTIHLYGRGGFAVYRKK